jgi:hypothetical protein
VCTAAGRTGSAPPNASLPRAPAYPALPDPAHALRPKPPHPLGPLQPALADSRRAAQLSRAARTCRRLSCGSTRASSAAAAPWRSRSACRCAGPRARCDSASARRDSVTASTSPPSSLASNSCAPREGGGGNGAEGEGGAARAAARQGGPRRSPYPSRPHHKPREEARLLRQLCARGAALRARQVAEEPGGLQDGGRAGGRTDGAGASVPWARGEAPLCDSQASRVYAAAQRKPGRPGCYAATSRYEPRHPTPPHLPRHAQAERPGRQQRPRGGLQRARVRQARLQVAAGEGEVDHGLRAERWGGMSCERQEETRAGEAGGASVAKRRRPRAPRGGDSECPPLRVQPLAMEGAAKRVGVRRLRRDEALAMGAKDDSASAHVSTGGAAP